MSAQRNKTDKANALAWRTCAPAGSEERISRAKAGYRLRLLLTHRRNLKRKFLDLENAIRHLLKTFGIRINGAGRGGFARAVREAVAGDGVGRRADRRHAMRAPPFGKSAAG
jgi:transposase